MTVDAIVHDILRRELHRSESSWEESRARLHAADKGGWTRGGITAASWGSYGGWGRPATRLELDAITAAEAFAFYYRRHVQPFDEYADPLRILLVDFGVTTSHVNVYRGLQRALRDMGLYAGAIDGVVGPVTRAAIASCSDQRQLYLRVLEHRARHYLSLAFDHDVRAFLKANPTSQLHFALGWLSRCLPFVYEAPEAA